MPVNHLREILRPVRAGDDPAFHAEIDRSWRYGLLLIAGVEIGMTALIRGLHALGLLETPAGIPAGASAAFLAIGLLSLAGARFLEGRWLAAASLAAGLATAAVISWVDVNAMPRGNVIADLLMVLLVAVALFPAGLWLMLGFCAGVWSIHVCIARLAGADPGIGFLPVVTSSIVCAVLSAASLRRMQREHLARAETLEAQLRRAQSESAASMARIAAALSHELNSPLGALKSSVQSLVRSSERMLLRPDPKLVELQKELARTAADSARRLEDIVSRMQRFTNLDRAEVQEVDLRRLVEDVAALCTQKHKVRIDIGSVPTVQGKPHLLSGALAEILQRATDSNSEVRITATEEGGMVRLRVAAEVELSLEPQFGVRQGRVAAVNWTLYYLRQVLRGEGGDVTAGPGGVTITIPVRPQTAVAGA